MVIVQQVDNGKCIITVEFLRRRRFCETRKCFRFYATNGSVEREGSSILTGSIWLCRSLRRTDVRWRPKTCDAHSAAQLGRLLYSVGSRSRHYGMKQLATRRRRVIEVLVGDTFEI